MRLNGGSMLAVMVGCALAAGPATAQHGATGGEWRSHSGDLGATKYSPLDQITAENFADLEVTWHWKTVDAHLPRSTDAGTTLVAAETVFDLLEQEEPDRWAAWDGVRRSLTRPSIRALVATPLMVHGVLYLSTALYQAAAIDARTGETLWVHDPRAYQSGSPPPLPWRHRGVAYWEDDGVARVFWGTGDGFLIAVDATTGLPAEEFGDHGRVDLTDGLPRAPRGRRDILNLLPISSQSPPLVVRDTVIVGSSINDRALTKEAPPGWVRAYDVRTGRPKWDFHTVPQSPDEFGADTWLDDAWRYSGNTNVWSLMSGDDELGFAYLPIGTATSDYYGGHRLGDNLFAESLVAVDAETGERQWHFQMVHHGLWDYDNRRRRICSTSRLTDGWSRRWRRSQSRGSSSPSTASPESRSGRSKSGRSPPTPTWQAKFHHRPSRFRPGRRRSSIRERRSTIWSTSRRRSGNWRLRRSPASVWDRSTPPRC
ncbi:MAG: PQQ-binding-like beta-propeller repeat protein [Acidobacteria bacterium]|nr:PQQ-binding-like beta-propeller repeat protein [Acidobacteriota bacterium]